MKAETRRRKLREKWETLTVQEVIDILSVHPAGEEVLYFKWVIDKPHLLHTGESLRKRENP